MEPIKFGKILQEILTNALILAPVISVGIFLTILNKCHEAGENIKTADAMRIYGLLHIATFELSFAILIMISS